MCRREDVPAPHLRLTQHTLTTNGRMDSVEALAKRLLPTLDVDFLQGEDFKSAVWVWVWVWLFVGVSCGCRKSESFVLCVSFLCVAHPRASVDRLTPPIPTTPSPISCDGVSSIPGFYRFAFLFSLEGTRRNIGPSLVQAHCPPLSTNML